MDDEFDWSSLDDETLVETAETLRKPIRHDRQVEKRLYIDGLKKQALTELVQELPLPNTDLYIISNGSGGTFNLYDEDAKAFEFGHFIPVILGMLGGTGATVYISTWTMNRAHALNLLELCDQGGIARLAVMTDPYFLRRESAVANELVSGIRSRGQRFRAFKNHAKVLAIANADNSRFCTVYASANLSSQPRVENFVLSTDPGLYHFTVDHFFEVMLK